MQRVNDNIKNDFSFFFNLKVLDTEGREFQRIQENEQKILNVRKE